MTRRADWVARMWTEINLAASRPFAWGEQDCCLFAARCVDSIVIGSTYVAELQAAYDDKPRALRYLLEQGGIHAACTARFGAALPWWKVRRGDLCLVATADEVGSLGVCVGSTIACVDEQHGITYVPLDRATAGWAVE